MYKQHKVGVVILAYNVEEFLKGIIEKLPSFVDKIYIVDDGSSDNSIEVVKALANSKICLICHNRNKGPGAAMSTGFSAALEDKMDVIVKLDGDGQMDPEQIEQLIKPIVEGKADYTKGDRLSDHDNRIDMPWFRLFGNIILTILTRIASGYRYINDTQNGFVAISKSAADTIQIITICAYYGYLNDILLRLHLGNFRVLDIPMQAKYGREKSSIKLGTYVIKVSFFLLNCFVVRLKRKHFTHEEFVSDKGGIKRA